MNEFRGYKVIKTKHSIERMKDRNVTNDEIYNTIKHGIILEENTLFYNNLYLIYDTNKYKKILIIITLIKGKEHLLTQVEKDIIINLNKLIETNEYNIIDQELTKAHNDFVKQKVIKNDGFEFIDLLNYTDPFIKSTWSEKKVYNENKKSIVMNVLSKGNLSYLDLLITKYSIDIGKVKKVYSTAFTLIRKFEKKSDKSSKIVEQIEEDSLMFIKSLEFVIAKYKENNQFDKIDELVNSKSLDGYTPLMMSLYKGLDQLSCFLIKNGANISINESNKNKRGESILDLCDMNDNFLIETKKLIGK